MTAIFPLPSRPALSYKESPRSFGALRDHGQRLHAACDLYAAPGTPVLACLDGVILRGPYLFYDVVYALEVEHLDGSVIRYGEIAAPAEIHGIEWPVASGKLLPGVSVKAGQVIGFVGKMQSVAASMLHFELYTGMLYDRKALGMLTDRKRPPYLRRADLIDPTGFLDACALGVRPRVLPVT